MDLLAAMRVFARVVERGNLSAAARDLGMGQPAVSERVARLEAYLQIRLLHRNTRTTLPTDLGLVFYERCKKALEAAAYAESISRKDVSALRGTLRVAAPHGLGELVLPRLLMRFREDHPDLKMDLLLNDRIVDPVTEGVDLSLRLGDASERNCLAEHIGHVERQLVAAPLYLAGHAAPARPEELKSHPFLRVAGIFNDGFLPLGCGAEVERVPITTTWTVSNWRPLHALLLAGAGIGVLQMPACRDDLAAGRLVRLLPRHEVPGFDLRLLYPKTGPVPEKTRRLADFLKTEFAELRGGGAPHAWDA